MKVEDANIVMKTAKQMNMVACHYCGKVWQMASGKQHCLHCGGVLHQRKPNSIERSWAYLIAACIMYMPANLMPIMITNTLFNSEKSTIMQGVILFWIKDEKFISIIIFVASFVVPLIKIFSMFLLLITVQRGSIWGLKPRTRLYQMLEFIGRWSMLDVFVVALMVGLVQMPGFANIEPGFGVIAFSIVVVLTMLASLNFDPRLIWDATHKENKGIMDDRAQ
jgi:paraquat-inducible protein A